MTGIIMDWTHRCYLGCCCCSKPQGCVCEYEYDQSKEKCGKGISIVLVIAFMIHIAITIYDFVWVAELWTANAAGVEITSVFCWGDLMFAIGALINFIGMEVVLLMDMIPRNENYDGTRSKESLLRGLSILSAITTFFFMLHAGARTQKKCGYFYDNTSYYYYGGNGEVTVSVAAYFRTGPFVIFLLFYLVLLAYFVWIAVGVNDPGCYRKNGSKCFGQTLIAAPLVIYTLMILVGLIYARELDSILGWLSWWIVQLVLVEVWVWRKISEVQGTKCCGDCCGEDCCCDKYYKVDAGNANGAGSDGNQPQSTNYN